MTLSDTEREEKLRQIRKALVRNKKLQEKYSETNNTAALAELRDEERRINEDWDKLISPDQITMQTLSDEETERLNADIAAHPEYYRSVSLDRRGKLKYKKIKAPSNKNTEQNRPTVLVLFAKLLSKLFPVILTIYTLAIVLVFLSVWQIYKAVAADSWQAIFHTKYTLYVVGYFVIFYMLKKANTAVYAYAHD